MSEPSESTVTKTALALPRRQKVTPVTPPPTFRMARAQGELYGRGVTTVTKVGVRPRFRRRRKRGGDGFNYREMIIALDPATAERIGLTARSKTSPTLFDHPSEQGSDGD